jgi:hypothetical protein
LSFVYRQSSGYTRVDTRAELINELYQAQVIARDFGPKASSRHIVVVDPETLQKSSSLKQHVSMGMKRNCSSKQPNASVAIFRQISGADPCSRSLKCWPRSERYTVLARENGPDHGRRGSCSVTPILAVRNCLRIQNHGLRSIAVGCRSYTDGCTGKSFSPATTGDTRRRQIYCHGKHTIISKVAPSFKVSRLAVCISHNGVCVLGEGI